MIMMIVKIRIIADGDVDEYNDDDDDDDDDGMTMIYISAAIFMIGINNTARTWMSNTSKG